MTLDLSAQRTRARSSTGDIKQLSMLCWGLLLVCFVLPFCIVVVGSHSPPDGDFAGFYSLGRIVNTHPLAELYNFELLQRTCTQVHPRSGGYGPLPYPPQVGLFFALFARMPYWVAYLLWVLISLALYASGLKLLIDHFFPLDAARRSLVICFAFCYCPFLVDTAASGQLTAVGFAALCLVLREDDRGHFLRSGLALSLCIYKPTLLFLLLPMLVATRRFRTLLGFTAGAAALSIGPTVAGGFAIWPEFFRSIFSYGKVASGAQAQAIRLLVKYVDLSSFSALLPGGRSRIGLIVLFGSGGAAILTLVWFWLAGFRRKSSQSNRPLNSLLWAGTITWTLLLNLYVPIYDSTLVVLSLIVTAGVLRQIPEVRLQRIFTVLWILILVGSWFTTLLAGVTGVQLLTLLIAALGILQFLALKRIAAAHTGRTAAAIG